LLLTWSSIAASVVDLPEPVGPVTSTRPRGFIENSAKIFGAASSSSDSTRDGIVRMTADEPRSCMNALTRKRASPGSANEKSTSYVSS